MIKKNCKKTLALAAAGLSIFEAGAICGNVLEITSVAAYERQVTMDKVSIISQGTEVGKNLTANVTDINGTTSAAVTVVLNEEIFVDNIVSNYDENQKVESIRAGLEEIKTINVNLKINGLEINTDIEVLQGNTIYTCGWLIKQDREDEEDWETDNIIYVTLRTNKLKFNKDGIEYEIPNFEYNTVVDVSPQNTGNNTAVELKSVNINGTLKVGETLSAVVTDVNDNLVNSDVAYRWYRYDKLESGLGIEVGKESTYKLQKDDKGKYIKLVVTNDNNSVEVMSGKINAESSSSSTGGSSSSGGSSST
ncbi:MAG: hypothetical protein ACI398_10835, partial [Clostridium sp.]